MQVGLISLGCVKNQVDSEQMLSQLTQAGYRITNQPEQAEVLIVNTCGFIASAKEESIDAIFEMAQYKQTGRCKVLCVTGCLAQRYAQDLLSDIPEIDCLLGVSQYDQLLSNIEKALQGARPHATERKDGFLECGRVLITPPYSAYIKTGDGCSNRCAYCAIPLIRGNYRSRPRQDILDEMRALAQNGVKEHILIAQDTTRYGSDTGDSLAALMAEAAQIPGVFWLRALYMYPDAVTEELLNVMAAHENICRYLDLPLQHCVPRLLSAMNRRGDMEKVKGLLRLARAKGFALRTTFIVGFPGETDADFECLMDFAKEIEFDRMGAFAFSPEEDTTAAVMDGQIDEDVKQQRLERLMALQGEISYARNLQRVGEETKVLVTWQEGSRCRGRSAWEAPDADGEILFTTAQPLRIGQFVTVRITGADTYDLEGECL